MLDIKRIRDNPDEIRTGLERRGADLALVERVIELDRTRRARVTQVEELKNQRNADSKVIGQKKRRAKIPLRSRPQYEPQATASRLWTKRSV